MNLTPRTIIHEVASYYRVNENSIYSIRRHAELIKYKHIAIHFIYNYLTMSLNQIGREFPGKNGHLDHATVLFAVKSVQNQIDSNKRYAMEINEIDRRIKLLIEDPKEENEEVYQENDFFTKN